MASQIVPPAKGRQLSEVRSDGKSSATGIPLDKNGQPKLQGYSNQAWRALSCEVQGKIRSERSGLGISPAAKKSSQNHGPGKKFKNLAKTVRQQGKVIAALTATKRVTIASENSDDSDDESGANDAGVSFGGRESKKKLKSAMKKAKSDT